MSNLAAATLPPSACQAMQPPPPAASSGPSLWSHGGFGFKDLLDIVNPLQHLPVIGSIYRYLTGDEPSGGARIVGDAIYGGPIGFGVGVVTTMLTDRQGEDLGEQVLASVFGPSSAERASDANIAKSTPPAKQSTRTASLDGSNLPLALAAQGAGPSHGNANTQTPAQAVRLAAKLYRSPAQPTLPSTTTNTRAQPIIVKNPRFERQMTTTRTADGRVLNNHPVPLELSNNLLPPTSLASTPAHPALRPKVNSPAMARSTALAGVTPDTNPIARKMLEALDKYEQLKKKQEQEDNAKDAVPPKVNLSL